MKKILTIFALFVVIFSLTACDKNDDPTERTDEEVVAAAKESLDISGDLLSVTENLTLVTSIGEGVSVSWESSNPEAISSTGTVTRPEDDDVDLTLTATLTYGEATDTKSFTVRVLKRVIEEVEHKVELDFNNASDADVFSLGNISNMHTVENGQLIITHTGETDYPSKGARIKVSTDTFPYLAFKVDQLIGNNAKWAAKVHINGSVEDFSLISDSSEVGLIYADLTSISQMPVEEEVELDLYIYILGGENNYIAIDYIQSLSEIPETLIFDSLDKVTTSNVNASIENNRLNVISLDGESGVVNFSLYSEFELAQMLDLFVLSVGENTTWSLYQGDTVLLQDITRNGAFSIDASEIDTGDNNHLDYRIEFTGEMLLDSIANRNYDIINENFVYSDLDQLLFQWKEKGSARLDIDLGNESTIRLQKALPDGDAIISKNITTNFSAYPEMEVVVDDITSNAILQVRLGGTVLKNITSAGTYNVNVIDYYFRDRKTETLEFVLIFTGDEFVAGTEVYVDLDRVSFLQNDSMSQKALPPKGVSVIADGGVNEQGYNDNNWSGNARVVAQDGKILVVNTDWFSKAEVFSENINVVENPYINIKIDELTSNTNWVLELIINPGTDEQRTVRLINENSTTGKFSFDVRDYFDGDHIAKLSYSIFVVGGADKVITIDYLVQASEPNGLSIGEGDNFAEVINWTLQDNMSMTVENNQATVTLNSGGYGKVSKTFLVNVSNTPYLFIDIESSQGTWKLDPSLIAETNQTGQFYVDLSNMGSGLVTLTLDLFVVGGDGTELVINSIEFVEEDPNEVPIEIPSEFENWTELNNMKTDFVEDRFIVTLLNGGFGKISKTITVDVDATPYLYLNIDSIGGTWKVDPVLLAETNLTGEFYLDLTTIGTGTITFELDLFVIGGDGTQLVINEMAFVDSIPEQIPETYRNWTEQSNMDAEYMNNQFVVTLLNGGFGKISKTITVDVDATPYLYLNIESIGGTWKVDPTLLAETNLTGEFYLDLTTIGTGTITFELDLFVVGGDGTQLVINEMAFVDSIPEQIPETYRNWTEQSNMDAEYMNNQFVVTLLNGGFGKISKTITVDVDATPYLFLNIESIGGTWKVDPTLLDETNLTGEFYLDLTTIGTGTITFDLDLFVVGGDGTQLVINEMAFVDSIPEQIPEAYRNWTEQSNMDTEYTNGQFIVTLLNGGFGKIEKSITVNVDETPYLYINISSLGGTWKVDPLLLAETSEIGEFYLDLTTIGSGTITFNLDIFVVGGDGTQLVIEELAFVETMPE